MSTATLQQVFDAARAYLNDVQVSGGEIFTNTILQPSFAEAYRTLFNKLMGVSKRVEKTIYVNFPASTTILIPSTYNIMDFAEPEVIEERPAASAITITSTTNATPINCLATGHGLSIGSSVQGVVSGVAGTSAPWGLWFATVVDANNFTLNGSSGDGSVGTGGNFTPWSQLPFQEVMPLDLASQGMDGQPTTYLGVYRWINEQLVFPGATGIQQLRITYWASGTAPAIPSQSLSIDNCLDFLSCATAANAARSHGWQSMSEILDQKAYGGGANPQGLLGDFVAIQVSTMQRGPQRRQLPFRQHKSRFGNYVIS